MEIFACAPVFAPLCLPPCGRAVLVLHVEHLLIDLLRRHAATEEPARREVAAVARVRGAHHVLRVEHLLRELRHRQRAVLLRTARRQRREAVHEEVKARERDPGTTGAAYHQYRRKNINQISSI